MSVFSDVVIVSVICMFVGFFNGFFVNILVYEFGVYVIKVVLD